MTKAKDRAGKLMLRKTICYLCMIFTFYKAVKE